MRVTFPSVLSFLRRRSVRIVGALALVPVLLVLVMALFTPLPPELREPPAPSMRVLARNGHLLREVRTDDGARARPLPLSAFPIQVRNAVLAAEDRGFYGHHGVDLTAVIRAAASNVWHRRIVSGASTITMQLARTLRPHRRSFWGKLVEVALAIRIEASLSKDEILEAYLNHVIYGPNLRGYAAASIAYLGTPPESLSLAEAALIAGLPRGPSLYALNKRPELARRRRDRVLARMAEAGLIDDGALARATAERVVVDVERPAFGAPHLVRALATGAGARIQPALGDLHGTAEITTTIDPDLQRTAESAVITALAAITAKHVSAAAVVVIDNATGDILAWVGSPGFFDAQTLGQNDGVIALRQPGSSLKPFVYAEAMSRLGWTPATMLPDVELHIPLPGGGDYVPHDYDEKLRGPIRLREALGNSLNVPAVAAIQRVGTAAALDRLHAFGFASLKEDAEHYGPALALGDGEVTLLELTNAYAALARGGLLLPVRVVTRADARDFSVADTTRVLDERSAAMLADVLSDRAARLSAFGDQNVLELDVDVAAKTGTSKGYRDNVAVGFTRAVTVGVWAGNFDGSPMQDVSGITGAGPIFRTVMEAAARARPSAGSLALGRDAARLGLAHTAVCALSGEIATADCPHRIHEWLPADDAEHAPTCGVHARVVIDRRNGLLAGPECPREVTETHVLERWSAPYKDWAARMDRSRVPEESSPYCPVAVEELRTGIRITQPFDGARFVIDPDRPGDLQKLAIHVTPEDAEVRVDGALLAKDHAWQLEAGTHEVRARHAGVESAAVRFTVR